MKVTVIFEENKILVDNVSKDLPSLPSYDPNWRVLQWGGVSGWIEVHQGDRVWLDNDTLVLPFIDAWQQHEEETGIE